MATWGHNNDCGMETWANGNVIPIFDGTATGGNGVPTDGDCVHEAVFTGRNVINFQTLPGSTLGLTCELITGTNLTEADMSFNKNVRWVVGDGGAGCSNSFSLHGTATHEAGHVWGLAHVREDIHGNLTMSTISNGPCQQSEYTLGRGDVLGLT